MKKAEDMSNSDDKLIHVISVPFRIHARNGGTVYLQKTCEKLKDSKWSDVPKNTSNTPLEKRWELFRKYQSRAYFHPFVQRFLYDKERVRRFERNDVKKIVVTLDHFVTKEFSVTLSVARCELVLFQPDIGVLLLEVETTEPLNLPQTQLLLDSLRRLYPPYIDGFTFKEGNEPASKEMRIWKGGHCPVEVRLLEGDGKTPIGDPGVYREQQSIDSESMPKFFEHYSKPFEAEIGKDTIHFPWAAHWQTLLNPFVTDSGGVGEFSAHQLGDDRAPTMTYIAVQDPRSISRGDWMRLCFCDDPGTSHLPYAEGFMQDFEEKFCYDRYWYTGVLRDSEWNPSRILICGYSFTFVGSSADDFFLNELNGAHATFRNIYVEMGLIAHFQRAALLAASQRLSDMVQRDSSGAHISLPSRDEVRNFYDHFVEFTQNFWFDEISPQEQGREMFEMWRKRLRIQELYDEVRQELKDLVEYAELRATSDELNASGRLNMTVAIVGFGAIVLSFVSAIAGILGMNPPKQWELAEWAGWGRWFGHVIAWPVGRVPPSLPEIAMPLLVLSTVAMFVVGISLGILVFNMLSRKLRSWFSLQRRTTWPKRFRKNRKI